MEIFLVVTCFAYFCDCVYNIPTCFKLIKYGCLFFIASSFNEFSTDDVLFLADVITPFVNHGFNFILDSFFTGVYESRRVLIIWEN